jgi:hypothetical protein
MLFGRVGIIDPGLPFGEITLSAKVQSRTHFTESGLLQTLDQLLERIDDGSLRVGRNGTAFIGELGGVVIFLPPDLDMAVEDAQTIIDPFELMEFKPCGGGLQHVFIFEIGKTGRDYTFYREGMQSVVLR